MNLKPTLPRREDCFLLAESILVCQAAGIAGAVPTAKAVRTWYPDLEKPAFTPPSGVFAPIWTTLYALMGVSLYLVRKEGERGAEIAPALRPFAAQLGLNALWSFIFFGARSPRWAMLEILFLWAAIGLTMRAVWRVSPRAAILLVPYLLWTSFAVALNARIWRLNA